MPTNLRIAIIYHYRKSVLCLPFFETWRTTQQAAFVPRAVSTFRELHPGVYVAVDTHS